MFFPAVTSALKRSKNYTFGGLRDNFSSRRKAPYASFRKLKRNPPEMYATEALPVDDPSRQDQLRRGRGALLGCVLSTSIRGSG